MRFAIVGQAGLLVEAGATRVVVDPWLVGSAYWRSWWPCPAPRTDLFRPSDVSAVYYTHEHPDHLHYPSLRRFPRDTRILVPRFASPRMAEAIRGQGFTWVEEIPHGKHAQVGPLSVYSYQCETDDSIVVLTDGETTLFNMNDAQLGGMALRHVLKQHPRVDFLFKSHSPAQAYPVCYSADDPRDLSLLTLATYPASFAGAAREIRPRYAIPFASHICHLHAESRDMNAHLVTPEQVAEACRGQVGRTDIVLMYPGDCWDATTGFQVADRTAFDRQAEIERLAQQHTPTLAKYGETEAVVADVDFHTFADYLGPFVRAVPWPMRRAFPARIAFEAPASDGGGYYLVDLGRARVEHLATLPAGVHSVIRANPRLVREAIRMRGFNLLGISKRIRGHLYRGGVTYDAAFWGLLLLYELEYFPITRLLNPRAVGVYLSRWREVVGYLPALLRPGKSLEQIIDARLPGVAEGASG